MATRTAPFLPAPGPEAPQPPTGAYAELVREVRERGLLRRRPGPYAAQAVVLVTALAAVVTTMLLRPDAWWLVALTPAMAVITTQTSFLGHDIGHRQVARSAVRSRALGLLAGNLLSGLSYSWWVGKHNAHHAHPNDLARDPDVAVGALVWDADQARSRRGAAAWWTRHQAALFVPLLTLEAVNLHVSSVRALLRPGARWRLAELTLLATHLLGYALLLVTTLTWGQALVFLALHKGLQGLYLGASFAPGHKGMPVLVADQARDPLLRQVLTSRDVRGGWWTDAVLGGLNYQIEHHLFPSMPRANLRHAQPVVRDFCARNHIPYAECSAYASYSAGLRHLRRVGSAST
jgi:fatty acid desaturase